MLEDFIVDKYLHQGGYYKFDGVYICFICLWVCLLATSCNGQIDLKIGTQIYLGLRKSPLNVGGDLDPEELNVTMVEVRNL